MHTHALYMIPYTLHLKRLLAATRYEVLLTTTATTDATVTIADTTNYELRTMYVYMFILSGYNCNCKSMRTHALYIIPYTLHLKQLLVATRY